jgi:hypothetical protein
MWKKSLSTTVVPAGSPRRASAQPSQPIMAVSWDRDTTPRAGSQRSRGLRAHSATTAWRTSAIELP